MTRPGRRGPQCGLTLIELVLTLTILAFAGALVSGALATGLRAWQTGLRSGREELVARIVLERVAAQLRAAIASPAKRDGADAVAFDAGEEHLRFVTLGAAGQAPVAVSYAVRGGGADGETSLVYGEFPWPDKEFFGEGRPRREERVEEVAGFSVKVVKRSEPSEPSVPGKPPAEESPSSAEWSPLDQVLPGSVTVAITMKAEGAAEPRRYEMTVPIPTRQER